MDEVKWQRQKTRWNGMEWKTPPMLHVASIIGYLVIHILLTGNTLYL